jgi:hypothetical protein
MWHCTVGSLFRKQKCVAACVYAVDSCSEQYYKPGQGGLSRELFTVFWTAIESSCFNGNIEKVPVLAPNFLSDFVLLGKILSHGFVLTGYVPLSLSLVCATYIISGSHNVSDDTLPKSFIHFVDNSESHALMSCPSGNWS